MKIRIILTLLFVSFFLQFVSGQCPDSTYNKFRIPRFYNTRDPFTPNYFNPRNLEIDKKYKCVDEFVELSTYYTEKKENLHISWYRDGKELPEFDGQLKIFTKDPGVYQFKNRYCDQAIMSEKYVIENRSSYISFDPNDKIGKSHTIVIETCLDTLAGGNYIPSFFSYAIAGDIYKNGKYHSQLYWPSPSARPVYYTEGVFTFKLYDYAGTCQYTTDTLIVKNVKSKISKRFESIDLCILGQNVIIGCGDNKDCQIIKNDTINLGNIKTYNGKEVGTFKTTFQYNGCTIESIKKVVKNESVKLKFNPGIETFDNQVINICKGLEYSFTTNLRGTLFKDSKVFKTDILSYGGFSISSPGTYHYESLGNNDCLIKSNNIIIKEVDIQNKLSTEILNQELCKGSTASVSLNTNAEEINWYNQQNELVGKGKTLEINKPNNYYAISKLGDCYKTSDWVFYKENEKPIANLSANSQDIYIGQKAALQLKFTGNPPFEFVINDTLKLNATTKEFTYSFVPIYNGEYKVTSVKNTCGLGTATGKAHIQVILANETSDLSDKISIFPNPSFEYVSIQAPLLKPNDVKIEFYNSQGKLIKKEKIPESNEINTNIDMQKLPSGTYNLRIQVGDSVYSRKIVKN